MINLYNIDCRKFMRDIPDNYYHLAIVDPPYFSGPNRLGFYGHRFSPSGVKRGEYKKINNWLVPRPKYFRELLRVSQHQIIFGINYYNIQNLGTGRLVWDKCNDTSSFSDCEIAYCSLEKGVRIVRYMWNGMMQGKSQYDGATMRGDKRKNEPRIHPTQKPVALYKMLLQAYAKPGDRVLDTHLGSGSIAIACHDDGFQLDACEICPEIYRNAKERLESHIGQLRFPFMEVVK